MQKSVAFSPDGQYALSGSDDKTIKLWDVETGGEVRTLSGHIYQVWSVAFGPDGRYALSGSYDRTMRLWNIETGQEFSKQLVKAHLRGEHTMLPVTIFSNDKLSPLETIVKYLREDEGLQNGKVALLLGRSPAAVWITYRNAVKKMSEKLVVGKTRIFISTELIAAGKLSVLETISYHLHDSGITYNKIGRLLNRDERTIWTVCNRARKKLAR